jgi:hypothetical protein
MHEVIFQAVGISLRTMSDFPDYASRLCTRHLSRNRIQLLFPNQQIADDRLMIF